MAFGQIVAGLVLLFVLGYGIQKSLARKAARAALEHPGWPWSEGVRSELLRAVIEGVDAYAVVHPVTLDWAVGRMISTLPPALVSLAALAREVSEAPEPLLRRPSETIEAALSSMLEAGRGVLPLDEDWYVTPFRDLSAERFTDTVHDVLTSSYVRGLVHHKSDAMLGYVLIGVEPSEAYTAETTVPSNELWLPLAAIRARCTDVDSKEAGPDEVLRRVLRDVIASGAEPSMWVRGRSSEAEREVVLAGLNRSQD